MSVETTQDPKKIIKTTINQLKEQNIIQGLEKGSRIPNFELKNQDNQEINLYNKIGSDKLIISFYRGDWCGYCRSELEDLRDHYEVFKELGAEVIAIAPQDTESGKKLRDELELPFDVLSDPELSIAQNYNLVWKIPEKIKQIYLEEFDLNVPELNANNSWSLPVPATFIVNDNGTIIDHHIDLNYSKRMKASKIIEILKQV